MSSATDRSRELRGNRLLMLLSPAVLDRLEPHLAPTPLRNRDILYRPDVPIDVVYFPSAGAASIVAFGASGNAVEVGTVGREGIVGLAAVLGGVSTPMQTLIQLPGAGSRMPMAIARAEYASGGEFADIVGRYTVALMVQTGQSAACNRLHSLSQRVARWLLTMHDRVDGHVLPVTHDFLSIMLGTARPKVTMALSALSRSGLVSNGRAAITIVDRCGLEAASCECYDIIRTEYDRVLGVPTG
jgi:CRP-like cAMP-binding protein